MLPELLISSATETDVPALVQLANRAYRGDASRQGWTTEAHLLDGQRTDAEDIIDLMKVPGATFLLARTSAGQLMGSVYLKPQLPDLYLGMLSVEPGQQGLGIGKLLLDAAETQARAHSCTDILISVITVRAELIAWYERHGFQRTGETLAFPTDTRFGIPRQPLELLLMRKQLALA
ncbi:GNAT family N-acetyltransferase [Hymenobacter sp. J193]|uniref:GNAT family N-acetyltransferase n=1 Tax=Hymenobacter sp. J193 TaxID=2898429 RepID=UPI00215173D8|nr:GNAT family N-acetyltransferase [Hymenobacter sp. J193]MCR5890079.1 GNAT family N-acetyltransferase [Hymenobacter sp. J193]